MISNLHTLSIVEEPEFLDLLTYVTDSVKVMSRRNLVRHIEKTGETVETALTNELSKVSIEIVLFPVEIIPLVCLYIK